MRHNELFDRKALSLIGVAKRGAISEREPATQPSWLRKPSSSMKKMLQEVSSMRCEWI